MTGKNTPAQALSSMLNYYAYDPFSEGDVIRWTWKKNYVYAALKIDNGWYTTGTTDHPIERHIDSFGDLLAVLRDENVSDVLVASVWEEV